MIRSNPRQAVMLCVPPAAPRRSPPLHRTALRIPSAKPMRSTYPPPVRLLALCVFALLTHFATPASSLHFYLDAGKRRCFSDTATPNTKVLIEYTVSTGTGVMPVGISVSLSDDGQLLLSEQNVEHGKMAFVVPFPDKNLDLKHMYHAEAHRKRRDRNHQRHTGHHDPQDQPQQHQQIHRGQRRLLATDVHDPDHRAHGMSHDDHSLYEDDLDDDLDDMDWDDYQGIHDEELDKDIESGFSAGYHSHDEHDSNKQRNKIGSGPAPPTTDDSTEEEELFSVRKFELCVSNDPQDNRDEAKRRRVRLSIRKGDTAVDYTRLAKTHHMSHLETSLKRISNELKQLMAELDRTQQMEHVLYRLNQGTSKQVVILGIVSLVVMGAVAAYQATYTRQYFKQKKIV